MNTDIWIINGIPGSGKSTLAKRLAGEFESSAYIQGDLLQDFIISGNVSPGEKPQEEERRQIHLNVFNQCSLAKAYCEYGFTPVIDYILTSKQRLEEYRQNLQGFNLFFVTLNPGIEVALERDRNRPEKTVASMWTHLEKQIKTDLSDVGLWIENGTISVDETLKLVLENIQKAKV